jgi:long-subunit acyl-CoA synthetase (AMP-forming)
MKPYRGYRNDAKGTRESFHDGWLRTGDVVKMDSDGLLWFQDRKKEMIKYKGYAISKVYRASANLHHPEEIK